MFVCLLYKYDMYMMYVYVYYTFLQNYFHENNPLYNMWIMYNV